jgi:hypothetical protein
MQKVYLVILQSADGALLPIAAYEKEEKAISHVKSCNYRQKDEDGYEMISSAEKLNCFAWLKIMTMV